MWWGVEFVRFGWNQTSEIAELPMWTIFIAWPLTGVTWVLFLGEQFLQDARIVARGPYDRRDDPGRTAALILFGIFFTLMLLRVPVAFALGLACVPMYSSNRA